MRDPPLSQGRQYFPDTARYPWDETDFAAPNLIFHPATDAATDEQIDHEFSESSRTGRAWQCRPVLIRQLLVRVLVLRENQNSPAAVEDRGYSSLMFGDSYSHGCTHPRLINFRAK